MVDRLVVAFLEVAVAAPSIDRPLALSPSRRPPLLHAPVFHVCALHALHPIAAESDRCCAPSIVVVLSDGLGSRFKSCHEVFVFQTRETHRIRFMVTTREDLFNLRVTNWCVHHKG